MSKTPPMTEDIETLKSQSRMLGRIAGLVSEFADDDESTTEECVIELVARYRSLQASEVTAFPSELVWACRKLDMIRKEKKQ